MQTWTSGRHIAAMPPAPASCLTCNRPFPENHDLASIPDAAKIAFDPAHRRVWRICASCGEWNLLGPDAVAAALPEIEARFASASTPAVPELRFAPARVSSRLEILRIGLAGALEQDDPAAARLRHQVDHRKKMMRRGLWGLTGLFAIWCAFVVWYSHGNYSFVPLMLLLFSSVTILQHIVTKVRRTKVNVGPSLLISGGAFVVGLVLSLVMHQQEQLRYVAFGLLWTVPLIVALDFLRSSFGVVRVRLADGSRLRLSETQLPQVTISWTQGATDLSLHDLPKGRVVAGPDVPIVFRKIYPWSGKPGLARLVAMMTTVNENAYRLLSTVGGLGGLLRALDGFRRDNDGRVLLSSLPIVYLVALDLALSGQTDTDVFGEDVRQRALAAAEIANEAERLDERPR